MEKDSFSASPVSKIVAADFGLQHGIPVEVVGKWWYHCDEREWRHNDGTRIVNWQSSLQKWFLREKQMNMLFISGGSGGGSVAPLGGNPRKGLNEEIRKQQLEQQHREREQNDREGVSMPEHLARRFAKFGK